MGQRSFQEKDSGSPAKNSNIDDRLVKEKRKLALFSSSWSLSDFNHWTFAVATLRMVCFYLLVYCPRASTIKHIFWMKKLVKTLVLNFLQEARSGLAFWFIILDQVLISKCGSCHNEEDKKR